MKRIEKIHRYRGWNTAGGQCGLEIFDPPDGIPVMVLTQLPWNVNTSVTNMIEYLAAEAALAHLRDRERSKPAFRCIEHTYSWLGAGDLFELVKFPLTWPRLKKNWDRPCLGSPAWRKLSRQDLEALIGEPYVERFRHIRQIPPPTETTIEAVRLLRTHFGRLARSNGPLAAALGREDLPVTDPPESAGDLFVTEIEQWL
ncbi:MAG TPA: hypothetical protein VMI06_17205, partial [Terriglobia bacterium]|nr:hypothetical protein [Terriglobia bacterium]